MPIKMVRKTTKPASAPAVPPPQASSDPFTLTNDDEILTVEQAAELTGYAEVTVRRWMKSGILAHHRAGCKKTGCKKDHRAIRIRKSDLFKVFDQG
jgi:excisionase family DNA binding protein